MGVGDFRFGEKKGIGVGDFRFGEKKGIGVGDFRFEEKKRNIGIGIKDAFP